MLITCGTWLNCVNWTMALACVRIPNFVSSNTGRSFFRIITDAPISQSMFSLLIFFLTNLTCMMVHDSIAICYSVLFSVYTHIYMSYGPPPPPHCTWCHASHVETWTGPTWPAPWSVTCCQECSCRTPCNMILRICPPSHDQEQPANHKSVINLVLQLESKFKKLFII